MSAFKEDDAESSKRDILVNEHLSKLGIMSIIDASDDLLETEKEADKILGKGNDN